MLNYRTINLIEIPNKFKNIKLNTILCWIKSSDDNAVTQKKFYRVPLLSLLLKRFCRIIYDYGGWKNELLYDLYDILKIVQDLICNFFKVSLIKQKWTLSRLFYYLHKTRVNLFMPLFLSRICERHCCTLHGQM